MQAIPFVGRKAEQVALTTLLQNPQCRLLTVLGPGGIGKTRLAVQTAQNQYWPDGVYFAALAGLSTPDYLVPALASALDFAFYAKGEPRQQLLNFLQNRQMLLVIDNFEHLLDGVDVLVDILEHAPGVKLLVTSRERLKLKPEWVFEIGGLPFQDDHNSLTTSAAQTLFLHNAQRLYPGFVPSEDDHTAIQRICRLVEGMPLALELASAWVRMLSCPEIADEIERSLNFLSTDAHNVPDRHRSIHSACDSSWQRLSSEEQRVFSTLSIFQGGFRADAARSVSGCDLRILAGLVDKSLVIGSPAGRFSIHELLRQYAREKLAQHSDDLAGAKAGHSAYYLGFLAQWAADLKGQRQQDALKAIREELDNIRAAWLWAVEQRDDSRLAAALQALGLFYELESRFQEGLALFDKTALILSQNSLLRCNLLNFRGSFRRMMGQFGEAQSLLRESLRAANDSGSQAEKAFTYRVLANIAAETGDVQASKQFILESLDLYHSLNDRWGEAQAQHHLAFVLSIQGPPDNVRAQQLYQEAAAVFRELGDRSSLAKTLANLGWIAHANGDNAAARAILEESLAVSQQIGYQLGASRALDALGMVMLWGLHQPGEARDYCEQSLAIRREIGEWAAVGFTLNNLADIAYQMGDYPAARRSYTEYLELARRINEPRGIALALGGLGDVACAVGEYETSVAYFQQAFQIALDKAPGITLVMLWSIARLFQKMGFRDAAAALCALLLHHPHSASGWQEMAANLLAEVTGDHPTGEILRRDPQASIPFIFRHIPTIATLLGVPRQPFDDWVREIGDQPVSAAIQAAAPQAEALSQRERDVLCLLGEGCSNPEIAQRLVIGKGTVKTHTLNIYRKLNVNNRLQAVIRARELKLL